MSTVSSAEGGRIRAVVTSQKKSAFTRPPVRAFRHGCSGEISSLRFGGYHPGDPRWEAATRFDGREAPRALTSAAGLA